MSLGIQSSRLRALLVCGVLAAASLATLAQGPVSEAADNRAATRTAVARNDESTPIIMKANQGQAWRIA